MQRSKRPGYQRLDYRVLHSSGRKVVVSSSGSESDGASDNDSQDLSNTSNKLLDPLLISRFEELSCQSTSDIQSASLNESVSQSVSNSPEQNSVLSTTIVASSETETEVLESDKEVSLIQPSSSSPSVDESSHCLIQSYQPLLTDKSSFEVSEPPISLGNSNQSQDSLSLLPPEICVHSASTGSSLSNSFLDSTSVSISDFATPLVNSTVAFDFPEVNSNLQTEPSHQNSDSNIPIPINTITNDHLLSCFSSIAYHVCGLKVLIAVRHCLRQNSSRIMSASPSTEAGLAQKALGTDLDDYLDENPITDCESTEEVDACVARVEDLRSMYRLRHMEYSNDVEKYSTSAEKVEYEERIEEAKLYLKKAKERKKLLKRSVSKRESETQRTSREFLIKEINNIMSELSIEFDCHGKELKDEQITTKKLAIPHIDKKMVGVANSIKELISYKDVDSEYQINQITDQYDQLCSAKSKYVKFIVAEADARELSKSELFNAGKLNIQLEKFSGFDSKNDIYTFQSEFIDLNQLTPKRYLARKLKNNHLQGPALALVKNVDDIEEIWYRLKEAYGDPKFLLKKKLSEFDSVSDLWKARHPEKVSNFLSKLINIMRDLMKLADDHRIEERLYSGEGLDRIYQLMGDERLTQWLKHIAGKKLSDKRMWGSLVDFL